MKNRNLLIIIFLAVVALFFYTWDQANMIKANSNQKTVEFFFDKMDIGEFFDNKYNIEPIRTNDVSDPDVIVFYFDDKNNLDRLSNYFNFLIHHVSSIENPIKTMQLETTVVIKS